MANKRLGLGFDFEPPSITRPATDEVRQLLAKGKLAMGQAAATILEAGKHWAAARDICPKGQWEAILREMGLSIRTVQWAIKKYRDQCLDLDKFLDEDDTPAKKKARERDAGEDADEPHEKDIKRINAFMRKRLAVLAKIKAAPAQMVDTAYRSLESLLTAYRQLNEAPTKPPPAIIEKLCDDCGGAIQLVPTPRGKIVALNQHPGKGRFSIIDGLAVVQKFGGQYRPHHLTCVAKQNRNGDV